MDSTLVFETKSEDSTSSTPAKIYALDPSERTKPCPHTFIRWNGIIPCTGIKVCDMCGTKFEE